MKLIEAHRLAQVFLREYATDLGFSTAFSGKNKTSGTGKSADSIATGKAKPYSDDTYLTAYEQKLPNLAKLTQKLKNEQMDSALTVLGPALEELAILIKAKKPLKVDEKGMYILPMGDNIRLVQVGKTFMIKYVGPKITNEREEKVEPTSTTEKHDKELLPDPF